MATNVRANASMISPVRAIVACYGQFDRICDYSMLIVARAYLILVLWCEVCFDSMILWYNSVDLPYSLFSESSNYFAVAWVWKTF